MTRTVMSAAPSLRSLRGAFSRDRYVPSGRISSTGSVNDAPIRHSSCAPVAAASRHSSQQAKFRSARHSIPSPSRPISSLARVFSPVPKVAVHRGDQRPGPALGQRQQPHLRERAPQPPAIRGLGGRPAEPLPVRLLILGIQRRAVQRHQPQPPPPRPRRARRRDEPGHLLKQQPQRPGPQPRPGVGQRLLRGHRAPPPRARPRPAPRPASASPAPRPGP